MITEIIVVDMYYIDIIITEHFTNLNVPCSGEETVATIAGGKAPPVGNDCHTEILSRLESTQSVQKKIPFDFSLNKDVSCMPLCLYSETVFHLTKQFM